MRRARAKRPLGDEFPALRSFLAGYLHEDFVQEHQTADGAARAFHHDASPLERTQLAADAARFLTLIEVWPWADVREALGNLGAAWRPQSRAALVSVLSQLTR